MKEKKYMIRELIDNISYNEDMIRELNKTDSAHIDIFGKNNKVLEKQKTNFQKQINDYLDNILTLLENELL